MGIRFRCSCGEEIARKDKYAGLTVQCPSCDEHVKVPDPDAETPSDSSDDEETAEEGGEPGILQLAVNLLTNPFRTLDTMYYQLYTGSAAWAGKILLFYFSSLIMVALVSTYLGQSAGEYVLQNILELIILSLIVSVAGRWIGGGGSNWIGLMTIFMFIYGVTNWFLLVVLAAGLLGLINAVSFGWIIITYGLWRLFLYLLTLKKAFGIGLFEAFFIAFIGGLITDPIVEYILNGL